MLGHSSMQMLILIDVEPFLCRFWGMLKSANCNVMIWGCFSWSGLGTASQQSSWMYCMTRIYHQRIFYFLMARAYSRITMPRFIGLQWSMRTHECLGAWGVIFTFSHEVTFSLILSFQLWMLWIRYRIGLFAIETLMNWLFCFDFNQFIQLEIYWSNLYFSFCKDSRPPGNQSDQYMQYMSFLLLHYHLKTDVMIVQTNKKVKK